MCSNPKSVEEMLAEFEAVNHGPNHGCSFYFSELPAAESIELSLDQYFSGFCTPGSNSLPATRWSISTKPIEDRIDLAKTIKSWFFGQQFSPKIGVMEADELTLDFLTHLDSEAGEGMTYKVHVSPPISYDCAWDDFAFVGKHKSYLLHLGVSD